LDNGPPRMLEPSEVTETHTITGLGAGMHTMRLALVDESHQELTYPEASATVRFSILINFTTPAPMVKASSDQTITLPASANLDRTVSDGGLSNPSGFVMVAWNMVEGPGTVIFVDPATGDTVATFSLPGTHELHLTATDGKCLAIPHAPLVHPSTLRLRSGLRAGPWA